MTKLTFGIFMLMLLAACDAPPLKPAPEWEVNQSKRLEYFQICMKSLPAGPLSTQYNDWDEVVSECGSQAYYLALECVAYCKAKQ